MDIRYDKNKKISLYIFLSVIVSLFVAIEGTILLFRIFIGILPNMTYYIAHNNFIAVNATVVAISVFITIFLVIFISLINRKVKHIKFLTKEVRKIKKEGFGKQ